MNDQIEKAITAVGAVIEIAWFIYDKMTVEGFTQEESFQTAQKYILQSLKTN